MRKSLVDKDRVMFLGDKIREYYRYGGFIFFWCYGVKRVFFLFFVKNIEFLFCIDNF